MASFSSAIFVSKNESPVDGAADDEDEALASSAAAEREYGRRGIRVWLRVAARRLEDTRQPCMSTADRDTEAEVKLL